MHCLCHIIVLNVEHSDPKYPSNGYFGRVAMEITSTSLFPLMYITVVLFDSFHFTAF